MKLLVFVLDLLKDLQVVLLAFTEILLVICDFLVTVGNAFYQLAFWGLDFSFISFCLFYWNFSFLFQSFLKRTMSWLLMTLSLKLFQFRCFRKLILLWLLLRLKVLYIGILFPLILLKSRFIILIIFNLPVLLQPVKKLLHLIPKRWFQIIDLLLKRL